MVKRYCTLLKPGTLLNSARSPPNRRLLGLMLVALLFCCCCLLMACALRAQELFNPPMDDVVGAIRCGTPPPLELEAEELPDVVDSASTLLAASTTGLVLARLESNCERKPRLKRARKSEEIIRLLECSPLFQKIQTIEAILTSCLLLIGLTK